MSMRPSLFTRGLSGLSQSSDPNSPMSSVSSPAEQRIDAKQNFLKAMRPLPTQHYWNVWFDRQQPRDQTQQQEQQQGSNNSSSNGEYHAHLEQLGGSIESVQDFWRYNNNTPVDQIRMRESIYLFKAGFKPIWEDRRNILGGSWTFRVPKSIGPDVWTRVQLLAIGEKLQSVLEEGDQICGVGLSVRFNSHLISVWHRDASRKKSIDNILQCVLEELPPELRPKPDSYFYKRHSDHAGFKAPPELQAVIDSQRAREAAAKAAQEQQQQQQQQAAAEKQEEQAPDTTQAPSSGTQ
ncbi:translation initiation factor eIF 4e-like domain-containing protein [Thermothelomyces heterothallicus CBS 202.75]|uniref:translation initiation factor eIF 4e-like domain-containing protein n=1 Tax=Thermothelomyces heterothallicus CBS 202.75 TaxID=1149848 RepID=UPI0037446D05